MHTQMIYTGRLRAAIACSAHSGDITASEHALLHSEVVRLALEFEINAHKWHAPASVGPATAAVLSA